MAPQSLKMLCSLLACLSLGTVSLSHTLQKRAVTNPGPPGWTSIGCYTDQNPRTLTTGMTGSVPGGAAAMTVSLCTAACKSKNFLYAGLEYAQECWCGNAILNGGAAAASGCTAACKGNATEYCGGSNRLNVYQFGTVSTTSSAATSSSTQSTSQSSSSSIAATSSSSTTSLSSSSSSSSAVSSATGIPAGWQYKGCYVDNANGRVIPNGQPASQTNSVAQCVNACQTAGYTVAGMEYGIECFCGNALYNGPALVADSQCSMNCPGNAAQKCGAGSRLSVYATGNLTVYPVPKAQSTNLPGKWEYQGCVAEPNGGRIWKWQTILKNNTATECLNRCAKFGFMAGGMEYGTECFCGDVVDIDNNKGLVKPESDCKTVCPGDPTAYCGGGSRLTWYAWNLTDPLYKWNYPQGNDAGSYKFFVPGVVVPLMTTVNVNGKVTFVEKAGTGPPNSTGAFELDPSLVGAGDWRSAWRTMRGLKTDVFCSAGLILPDKAGRQINIGGWSGTSTYGLRLYTPDGTPGVNGTNDWQENAAEVKLQKGRWYPSAMVMSNGSMLVVGGEEGSNAAPVPSVEIVPQAGPVVNMDWLQRTDPLNLYPFLFVLPGGGIFVGYYNEARILDPVTLDTIRTLPQIPGNVNNPNAGRTYPLEGAAMMMPQVAPYTDPVTMLICGGSTVGPSTVNDNCVSIQPENPSSNWTIERMPSQRVMPCIAALPDGTYLIANGGQAGVAGFGLADTPNLNAVLYDPTKPLNERMSIMANTTVARMYHSEAILMQDGRVLISGSDPQSNKFPEEYRVEVFEPPYITSGAPRPAYTITNKDWAYGDQITITITAGNIANIGASLMGGVSSTHGNSMGQRTIFPAISCAGNTCTITAPPDNKVCPPGWFQLFILDGKIPSISTWVRIGGDPAQLGNWPASKSFTKPGI
ncbi:MAG: hypothetical protein L6R41_000841 [Letrouitia leprolyta]|nr:MAG: hypothetical protein L6R41_000841 [Letrouitia leprolyta]